MTLFSTFHRRALFALLLMCVALLSGGCEFGDKPIGRGDGNGQEFKPSGEGKYLRIWVDNRTINRVTIDFDKDTRHFELTVYPLRQRYIVINAADFGQFTIQGNLYSNADPLKPTYTTYNDTTGFVQGFVIRINRAGP